MLIVMCMLSYSHPFCPDEPTTGLDSTTSIDVTRVLRSIASLQVSVVAVLHQPRQEIFNLLDDLLLLAPGGKTVYFGPAKNTLNYFTKIGYPCPVSER